MVRVTAAVLRRSSQNMMGKGESLPKLRAKVLVDWQRGPSVPSMFKGRPNTIRPMFSSAANLLRDCASGVNLVRSMVWRGVAKARV